MPETPRAAEVAMVVSVAFPSSSLLTYHSSVVNPSSSPSPSETTVRVFDQHEIHSSGTSLIFMEAAPSPSETTVSVLDEQEMQSSGASLSMEAALESLNASRPHQVLLKEYQKEDKEERRRMLKKKKEVFGAQSEIYQLLGLFYLFQGVIFSAVAQSSILTCEYWGFPFSLALAVACGTLLALHQRLKALAKLRTALQDAESRAEALYTFIDDIQHKGAQFRLCQQPVRLNDAPPPDYANRITRFCFKDLLTYDAAVFLAVALLSVTVLVSCPRILCHGCACQLADHSAAPSGAPSLR